MEEEIEANRSAWASVDNVNEGLLSHHQDEGTSQRQQTLEMNEHNNIEHEATESWTETNDKNLMQPSISQVRASRPDSMESMRSVASTSSVPLQVGPSEGKWPVAIAIAKFVALLAVSIIILVIVLLTCLPPVDEEHKDALRIPKSIHDLKVLTETFKFYTVHHYFQVMLAYSVIFLFIQAFSIPGTFYMSIMGGALFGVFLGILLVCTCVATGALLSYYISYYLGAAIFLKSEKWRRRLIWWREQIQKQGGDNLLSYMVVLRMSPVPPHLVVNMLAPHLGIPPFTFWLSTWLGVFGMSFIYCQIGSTLDKISDEGGLHLFNVENVLGLIGIILCALIPVYIRRRAAQAKARAAAANRTSGQGIDANDNTPEIQQLVPLGQNGMGRRFHFADGDDEPTLNDANIMANLARQARLAAMHAANAATRAAEAAVEAAAHSEYDAITEAEEFEVPSITRPQSTFGTGSLSQWWKRRDPVDAASQPETTQLFVSDVDDQ